MNPRYDPTTRTKFIINKYVCKYKLYFKFVRTNLNYDIII